jgi:hypothetical protein
MEYTGKEDHSISLAEAAKMTKAHRAAAQPGDVNAHYVGREAVEALLTQPGCVGIRWYHARHPKGHHTLVAVGVDKTGNDLHNGRLCEEILPCPPWCSAPNPLNS